MWDGQTLSAPLYYSKINGKILSVDGGFTNLASNVFVPTKTRNGNSRCYRKLPFLLVGKHPKPFEQTAPLVWLCGISAAVGPPPVVDFII